MTSLSILDSAHFATLPPQFETSYQNNIQIAPINPVRSFQKKAKPINEFFTSTDAFFTRQLFTYSTIRGVTTLSQTCQFFYFMYHQMFPRLEMRLGNLHTLKDLSAYLSNLDIKEHINLSALDITLPNLNSESLEPILRHTGLLQTLSMYTLNAENMERLRECLKSNPRLKGLHLKYQPISGPEYKVKNIIDEIEVKNRIPVYVDNKRSKGALSRMSAFTNRFNGIIFCSTLWTSVALCIFLGIKYDVNPEYLILIICGVIFSTCATLITQAILRDRCAKRATFHPDYEALN